MLDLAKLRIFMVAAEYQNLSRAAEHLFLNHTTVSRTVTALEEHFGCPLMHRSQKGAPLTPAGKALYEYGRQLLDAEQQLEQAVRSVAAGTQGDLRIFIQKLSCEPFFVACELFSQKYPEVRLAISGIGTQSLNRPLQMLQDGQADGALLMVNDSLRPDLSVLGSCSTLTVGQSEFCLLISARHPLARRSSLTLEELVSLDLPVFRRDELLQMLRHTPPAEHFTRNILNGKELPDSINLDVRAGKMAAVLPYGLAEEASVGCKLLKITGADESVMLNDILFVWTPRSPNPSLTHFIDILRATVETLAQPEDEGE